MSPGQNKALNVEKLPPAPTVSTNRSSIPASESAKPPVSAPDVSAPPTNQTRNHEDTKTLLTIVAVSIGVVLYLVR